MECVFGLVGNDFAVLAADTSAVHSIHVHESNEDNIMILDSHKLIAASGESRDRVQFTEYIQKKRGFVSVPKRYSFDHRRRR
ncbi:hypothetical protein V6N13_047479 [Hibiscus sabdariffa]|uniref:Uncharacterized protein n=1 Tax=Hibiscus sabdariffa TaxID=183260 RepID=A0ABR2F4A9_9ROSI